LREGTAWCALGEDDETGVVTRFEGSCVSAAVGPKILV
jgi:hypothetical protein